MKQKKKCDCGLGYEWSATSEDPSAWTCETCGRVLSSKERLRRTVVAKLQPSRFPNMSGKMAALVGVVVGDVLTTPAIHEVTVTVDGMVLGRNANDIGFNAFIGSIQDVRANFIRLISCATLTGEETAHVHERFAKEFGVPLLEPEAVASH